MPTILYVQGWRFHFYSNEANEPMHVHAVKGDADCKYWLQPDRFDIVEDFEYNCTPRLRREVRQIIFEHFDRSEEHTSELQSRQDLPPFPARRSADLVLAATGPFRYRGGLCIQLHAPLAARGAADNL